MYHWPVGRARSCCCTRRSARHRRRWPRWTRSPGPPRTRCAGRS